MPKFISFFSYSAEATRAMLEAPSDRHAAAKGLVESLGGKLESFYWMQGDYDGFLISSFPDAATAAALSAAVGSTGSFRCLKSHELFERDAQMQIVKAAKKATATYKPPTAR